ncbi:unnamed protein product, partial [Ectocarpus sp. 12 AP-2014]
MHTCIHTYMHVVLGLHLCRVSNLLGTCRQRMHPPITSWYSLKDSQGSGPRSVNVFTQKKFLDEIRGLGRAYERGCQTLFVHVVTITAPGAQVSAVRHEMQIVVEIDKNRAYNSPWLLPRNCDFL